MIRRWKAGALLVIAAVACHPVPATTGIALGKESARTVGSYAINQPLGAVPQVQLIEVRYAPGGSSKPHRHSCPVVGYVIEGAIRSKVDDGPEIVYQAGQSFYESAGALHAVSANASDKVDARLLAIFLCPQKDQKTSSTQR
jgi:quercetin dioxygenase-like cupin family protein